MFFSYPEKIIIISMRSFGKTSKLFLYKCCLLKGYFDTCQMIKMFGFFCFGDIYCRKLQKFRKWAPKKKKKNEEQNMSRVFVIHLMSVTAASAHGDSREGRWKQQKMYGL